MPADRRRGAARRRSSLHEARTPDPMLPLGLFRRRNFAVGNLETLVDVRRAQRGVLLPRALPAAGRRLRRAAGRPGDAADHDRDVRAVAPRRAPRRPLRAALVHGRRPAGRRGRARAAAARGRRRRLRDRAAARAAAVLARAVGDRGAADRDRAGRRRRAQRRHRVGRQQRDRARGRAAGGRRARRGGRRPVQRRRSTSAWPASRSRPGAASRQRGQEPHAGDAPTPTALPPAEARVRGAGGAGRVGDGVPRGIGIAAALVALGGVLGLAGIRNPRREVPCADCPGGQLAGAPLEAARPRAAVPARPNTTPTRGARHPNPAVARVSAPRATLRRVPGPPADVVLPLPRVSSERGAALGHAARRAWPSPRSGPRRMGALVGLAVAIVLVAAERPSFLSGPAQRGFPGWMVGPARPPAAGAAPQPAGAPGRPHARARDPRASPGSSPQSAPPRVPAPLVWIAVVAAHVVLLIGPPLSLTDVFNYLHYGRMAGDLRPEPLLRAAAGRAARPRVPLLQLAPPPLALRAAVHAAHRGPGSAAPRRPRTGHGRRCCWPRRSATLALVAVTAKRLGRSPQAAVVFVGLNPLVLVYGIGGDHNEPLMLLCASRR